MRNNNYDAMDLKALRCFYIMAQCGSVSRASIELGVSEAAVSQRIKLLENYLGSKLYRSRGGKVRITAAGEQTFQFAMSLFDSIKSFEHTLDSESEAGEILLSAHDSVLRYLLPEKVKRFSLRYPKIRLSLLSRPIEQTLKLIRTNEIDLGIIAKCGIPSELIFQPICTHSTYLLLSKQERPASVEKYDLASLINCFDLESRPLICLEETQEGRRLINEIEGFRSTLQVKYEVGTMESLKHYVSLGLGFAVISGLSLTDDDRFNLRCVELPREVAGTTTYGIVTRLRKQPNPALEQFIKLLLETVK
ncbi:LysR family transcriptional regulator [Vibrio maritimus]|uniref:LysR family transcriptional regulator n=1 Tax=Vibrio maritimus TaxID=990268 RepID=UPI0037366443